MAYNTHIGSLDAYEKGTIELKDDLRKYAFSNVYEVAGKSAPFERVAVAQNLEYVAEAVRVEGDSPWYAAPHDEFAIVMDGEVTFRFVKLEDDQVPHHDGGAVRLGGEPNGPAMGRVTARQSASMFQTRMSSRIRIIGFWKRNFSRLARKIGSKRPSLGASAKMRSARSSSGV